MKRILIICICFALCLTAGCRKPEPSEEPTAAPTEASAKTSGATEEPIGTPEEPTEAPEEPTAAPEEPEESAAADLVFSTTTLSGDPIASDIIGDYDLIIVNFWAEWCPPCVGEMPALEKIHQTYPNVLIIGAWLGDSLDEALDTVRDTGVTYPVVQIADALIDYAGRSMYIPATYFFDKDGNEIGEPIIGGMEYDDWKAVVEEFVK